VFFENPVSVRVTGTRVRTNDQLHKVWIFQYNHKIG